MLSYAQLKQDLTIAKFYKNTCGYFLDVGANDGITYSNTYLLERKLRWTGLLFEPLPSALVKLHRCRKSSIIECAAYSEAGKMLAFSQDNLYSGITELIDLHVIAKTKPQIKVLTTTVDIEITKHNAPKFIHYMSLDTEGSELEVLYGMSFSNYIIGIINLEHNYVEPRRTQMREYLIHKGYIFLGENPQGDELNNCNVKHDWDDDYFHQSLLVGPWKTPNSIVNITWDGVNILIDDVVSAKMLPGTYSMEFCNDQKNRATLFWNEIQFDSETWIKV